MLSSSLSYKANVDVALKPYDEELSRLITEALLPPLADTYFSGLTGVPLVPEKLV